MALFPRAQVMQALFLRSQGFAVSDATVGRILADLVARGGVQPVPLSRETSAVSYVLSPPQPLDSRA